MGKRTDSLPPNTTCARCGKPYFAWRHVLATPAPHYCSRACAGAARGEVLRERFTQPEKHLQRTCAACGAAFSAPRCAVDRGRGKYCSKPCYYNGRRALHEGDERLLSGYIYVYVGDGTFKAKHRIIAEQMLGRPLRADEDVHHDDENPLNNDPSNLKVIDHAAHAALHHARRRARRA